MSNKPVQPDPEEQHKDLLATLAASRELGPEMDRALAESYLQKHPELAGQKQQQAVVAQPDQQRAVSPDVIGISGMAIGVVAYVALLKFAGPEFWWMFWPIMGWFGWRWGWGRGGAHDQVRQARYQARIERYRARAAQRGYSYGYSYRYNYGQPEEQGNQPQVQQPQQQPAQPQVSAPAPSQAPVPAPIQAQPLPPAQAPVTPSAPQPASESRLGDVPPLNPAG